MSHERLFVLIPGFGEPHLSDKVRILNSNLQKLSCFPGRSVDVCVCVYDNSDFTASLVVPSNIHMQFTHEPGIVGAFIKRYANPEQLFKYHYIMLLLDDIELQDNWDWHVILRMKKQFQLNILSPSLTLDSIYEYKYMLTAASNPATLKITSAAEMFCYLMDIQSYAAYYKYLDDANPWLWGIDLILHKHAGFNIGILNNITMRHYYKSTCYDKFPNIQPYSRFLEYLAKFNETPQTLADMPSTFYYITESAVPTHLNSSPSSIACRERRGEIGYLAMLQNILSEGHQKLGRNGYTLSSFGEHLEFDFKDGFPLLTTKRVFWKGIVEELLWFLKGHTNAKDLQEKGVHIWDGNTTREFLDRNGLTDYPEGMCGPIYGYQWRAFNGNYPSFDGGVDQLREVIEELTRDFSSRRALFSGWNPSQLKAMCLPPCHVLYQFTIGEAGLCCHMYQRSADTFLGVPFNIASTALLTTILATALKTRPHKIRISFGDTHIYQEHIDVVKQQISRVPYQLPHVSITDAPPSSNEPSSIIDWIESLSYESFDLQNYKCHSILRAEMKA